jgi:hypothetical protein
MNVNAWGDDLGLAGLLCILIPAVGVIGVVILVLASETLRKVFGERNPVTRLVTRMFNL